MTPDVEQIRAALAAATPRDDCPNCNGRGCMGCVMREWDHNCANDCPMCCAYSEVDANAPVWLATCLDEIERLREVEVWYFETCQKAVDLRYELAAALAERERLRGQA